MRQPKRILGKVQTEEVSRFKSKILKDIVFIFDDSTEIVVGKGERTDFASVPRLLWNVFPPHDGDYNASAAFHDKCYREGIETKEWADKAFLGFMEIEGTPKWKRKIIYLAVKLFGKGNY